MEIERKFLLKNIPYELSELKSKHLEQGYINSDPVVRIRRSDDKYFLTIKSSGLMKRIEVEKEITSEEYSELSTIARGRLIKKTRYLIPLENGLTMELDIFEGDLNGLIVAEVEFPTEEAALSFVPPEFVEKDVTSDNRFANVSLSSMSEKELFDLINL